MIPHQSGIVSRTEPTISYPFVTALCDAVGEDKEIVKAGLRHFELSGLAADVTRVPLRRYIGLFEWLAVELDHPYLGLELSQQTGPETLGAISYMFLGSRNLEMAIKNFSNYLLAVQDNSRMYLGIDGEYAFLHYGVLDQRITHRRHDSEYSIGYVWRLMQIFSANAIRLTMVEFEHDRPKRATVPSAGFSALPCFSGAARIAFTLGPRRSRCRRGPAIHTSFLYWKPTCRILWHVPSALKRFQTRSDPN